MQKSAAGKNRECLAGKIYRIENPQEKEFLRKYKGSKAELTALPTFYLQMFFQDRITGSDRRQLAYVEYLFPSLEIFPFSKGNKLERENLREKEFSHLQLPVCR